MRRGLSGLWGFLLKTALPTLLVVLLGASFWLASVSDAEERTARLGIQLNRMMEESHRLERENRRLKVMIDNLREGKRLYSKVARDEYGHVGRGDVIFEFQDSRPQ